MEPYTWKLYENVPWSSEYPTSAGTAKSRSTLDIYKYTYMKVVKLVLDSRLKQKDER